MVEATHHAACAATPACACRSVVPSRAVRRVVCEHCAEPYEATGSSSAPSAGTRCVRHRSCASVVDALSLAAVAPSPSPSMALAQPSGRRDRRLRDPAPVQRRRRRRGPTGRPPLRPGRVGAGRRRPPPRACAGGRRRRQGRGARRTPSSSASPPSRLRSRRAGSVNAPAGGATFAAVSPDGDADATLWIGTDPEARLRHLRERSLEQLETLAGSARVVERNVGPTPERDRSRSRRRTAPEGAPTYEVVLAACPAQLVLPGHHPPARRARRGDRGRRTDPGLVPPAGRQGDERQPDPRASRCSRSRSRPALALGGEEAPSGPRGLSRHRLARLLRARERRISARSTPAGTARGRGQLHGERHQAGRLRDRHRARSPARHARSGSHTWARAPTRSRSPPGAPRPARRSEVLAREKSSRRSTDVGRRA